MAPPSYPLLSGRLGLLLPPMAPTAAPALSSTGGMNTAATFGSTTWVTELARGAEDAGAAAVWASDHLFWRRPAPECLTSLAVAATATRRAVLGTCVLQLPLRSPAAVAKQAAALHALSGGRFVLGVGSGSHATEYALAGVSFRSRGKLLDSGIASLRSAWSTAEHPDAYRIEPAGPVPVWIGGSSTAALHRAGRLGDGWVPLFIGPERFADDLASVRQIAADAGRSPDSVVPAVVMAATVGDDTARARAEGTSWLSSLYGIPAKAFARHLVAGPAEHCAAAAAAYVDAGAAHVIVLLAHDDALGQFRALAGAYDHVVPGVRSAGRACQMARAQGAVSHGESSVVRAHESKRAEVGA